MLSQAIASPEVSQRSSIAVIVPTYCRPDDLARCLQSLQQQIRSPDEVVVVGRDSDRQTWQFLNSFDAGPLNLRAIEVSTAGVVAAMNCGLEAAQSDILAFTDDDAAPHPDWLMQIEAYFLADPKLGGIGGRDWVYHGNHPDVGIAQVVGQLQWFGRMIGNHHLGVGSAREVDILKGVNMSFRRAAIADLRFDARMRGSGAQVHFEVAFSLALKRSGWKLLYDPNIKVDHFCGQRFDEDQRGQFNEMAMRNAVHNETLSLLEHFAPLQQAVFLLWAVLVGTRDAPGLVQWLRFFPQEGTLAGRKWLATLRGRWQGWWSWQQENRMVL